MNIYGKKRTSYGLLYKNLFIVLITKFLRDVINRISPKFYKLGTS